MNSGLWGRDCNHVAGLGPAIHCSKQLVEDNPILLGRKMVWCANPVRQALFIPRYILTDIALMVLG